MVTAVELVVLVDLAMRNNLLVTIDILRNYRIKRNVGGAPDANTDLIHLVARAEATRRDTADVVIAATLSLNARLLETLVDRQPERIRIPDRAEYRVRLDGLPIDRDRHANVIGHDVRRQEPRAVHRMPVAELHRVGCVDRILRDLAIHAQLHRERAALDP